MLTSKQRAYLRGLANTIEVILTIGKGGVIDTVVKQADDALEKREIIKCSVLETSPEDVRTCAEKIAQETGADVVQVIGRKFVLYRPSSENPQIILPKAKKK